MKRLLIILSVILVIIIVVIELRPVQRNSGSDTYTDSLLQQRIEKDIYMKTDINSPFVTKNVEFKGLKYFDINNSFRVTGALIPFPMAERIHISMSDGTSENYLKYAAVNFYLQGKPQRLVIYKSVEYDGTVSYFMPFYDETSTVTTYGGGRYLDLDYNSGNEITLDFNLAYNPYCAYVEGYACPLPPAENRITVTVDAGEKKYKD